MAKKKEEGEAFKTKVVSESKSQKVWTSVTIEDIKSLGLDPEKVTGSEVTAKIRDKLGLPEKQRRASGGKGAILKKLKNLDKEELEEIAKEKGIDLEETEEAEDSE